MRESKRVPRCDNNIRVGQRGKKKLMRGQKMTKKKTLADGLCMVQIMKSKTCCYVVVDGHLKPLEAVVEEAGIAMLSRFVRRICRLLVRFCKE